MVSLYLPPQPPLVSDNDLEPEYKPGVSSILDWILSVYPRASKKKLFSDFWTEITERLQEEDLSSTGQGPVQVKQRQEGKDPFSNRNYCVEQITWAKIKTNLNGVDIGRAPMTTKGEERKFLFTLHPNVSTKCA